MTKNSPAQCEGSTHAEGINGHAGRASFDVVSRCACGDRSAVKLCRGRAASLRNHPGGVYCESCGEKYASASDLYEFVPLHASGRTLAALPDPQTVLNSFAIEQRSRGYSDETTIPNRLTTLRALVQFAGVDLLKIDSDTLVAYLGRPGVAASTRRANQVTIAAFYRFAQSKNHRKDDPSLNLPAVRVPRTKPRPFSRDQIEQLLGTGAYAQTRAMILLGYYQGFRVSSIARVHGRDVDVAGGTIRTLGKGSKDRTLPLHPVIAALAKTMPADDWWFPGRTERGGPIHPSSVSDLVRKARERAGITDERLTAHSLRHSFATHLMEDGTDIRVIQELMMHDSLASTQVYTGVSDRIAREGLNRLPGMGIPQHSGRGDRRRHD